MREQTEFMPLDGGVLTGSAAEPRLIGSRCSRCVGFTQVYGAPGVSACTVLSR
jgi:hypothetical protein